MRARLLQTLAVIGTALLVTIAASSASGAARMASPSYYTGYGFYTCGAPSLEAMNAWLD